MPPTGPCRALGRAWHLKPEEQGHVGECVGVNGPCHDAVPWLPWCPGGRGQFLCLSHHLCPCADSPCCSCEADCVCLLTWMHVSAPASLLPGSDWLWGGAQKHP